MGDQALGAWHTPDELIIKICISRKQLESPILYSSYSKVVPLMNNLFEATIITGNFRGADVLLPRIPMTISEMPFA